MLAIETSQTAPNQFLDSNGGRIVYRRFGADTGVPLVLLQRFRGNLDDWDPAMVDHLATKRPVIMFDDAGIGLSTGRPATDVETLARHAESFIAGLGLEKVDLLGYSLGGFVAQQVALDRPGLVRKLVLAGTAPRGGVGFSPFRPDVEAAARKDKPGLEDLLTIFFVATATSRASVAAYGARLQERSADRDARASLEVRDAQLAAINRWGASPADRSLAEITQPVLVANGDADAMIPTGNSYILQERLPNAQLIIYPDAGHGFLYQYPELFARHVEVFLDG